MPVKAGDEKAGIGATYLELLPNKPRENEREKRARAKEGEKVMLISTAAQIERSETRRFSDRFPCAPQVLGQLILAIGLISEWLSTHALWSERFSGEFGAPVGDHCAPRWEDAAGHT